MLITPTGSYDLRSISSVQFEDYGINSEIGGWWKCWIKSAVWLLASCWLFTCTNSWNSPAIITALVGCYILSARYLRINCVCDGKKYTLYKHQCGISQLWGKGDMSRAYAQEVYEFINLSVKLAKSS